MCMGVAHMCSCVSWEQLLISYPDSFGLHMRLSNCMHRYLNAAPFCGLIKVLHSESSSLGMMHKLSSHLQKSGTKISAQDTRVSNMHAYISELSYPKADILH